MNRKRHVLKIWSVFAICLIKHGCSPSIRNDWQTCEEAFCNGSSVTLIRKDETSVTGNSWRKHSGGYVVSADESSWLVHWPIADIDQPGFRPEPTTTFLGRSSRRLDRSDPDMHTIDSGIPRFGYITIGSYNVCINHTNEDNQIRVFEGDRSLPLSNIVRPDPKIPNGVVLTRSRQHVYALLPLPAIYSIPDLKLVRQIPQTENARIHNLFLRDIANSAVLTEDLAYLVAISSPTVVDGKNTTKVLCYNFESDENVEVRIPCAGNMLVRDAEATADGMCWAVSDYVDGVGSWSFLDHQLIIKNKITFPAWALRTTYDDFWVPKQNSLWTVEYMPLQVKSPVIIHKYDLGNGSHTRVSLTLPEMVIPEGK